MHSIEIDCFLRHPKNLDYMRNHFNFFVKLFYLPTSGFFRKIFRKISEFFEEYINFCKPVKFQKVILSHCELVVKGLKKTLYEVKANALQLRFNVFRQSSI